MSDKIEVSSKGTLRFAKTFGLILLFIALLSAIFIHIGVGLFFLVFSAMLLIPSYGKVEYSVHKFLKIRIVSILSVPIMIIAAYYFSSQACERRESRGKEGYMACMTKKVVGYLSGHPYITIE